MKVWLLIVSILLVSTVAFAENTETELEDRNVPQERIDVPHALLRGVANLGTFWMEIPREIIIEENYNPVYGIVTGLVKGSYYSGKRLVFSVFDIALLGFTGPGGYDAEFPEYVWDAQWNPWPKKANEPE
jgi:hypothetical protein